MAQVVQVLNVAHTPFCYMSPEQWEERRRTRPIRADVPVDPPEVNRAKHQRIQNAFATLRQKLAAAHPDVLVIFGDDQKECFDFDNFPAFAVYVGEEFEGYRARRDAAGPVEKTPDTWAKLKGHPALAVTILTGLMKHGFDPAFSMRLPNPARGMGHAFMRPAESLTNMDIPVVPIMVNCYYAPQPTAMRCYQLGKAVREIIEESPLDLRVAVIGSGGMWHTPGMKNAYLNEEFDWNILNALKEGDALKAAEFFDSYQIPEGDTSQAHSEPGPQITGMPGFGGPQGGIREICNHIAAGAVAGKAKGTIIDYVPVYASPIGAGFMAWENL